MYVVNQESWTFSFQFQFQEHLKFVWEFLPMSCDNVILTLPLGLRLLV